MSTVRCSQGVLTPFDRRARRADGLKDGHDRVRMKFKCRWCKRWVCGVCEGTHDDKDPVGNKLCDPCWGRRDKRLKRKPYA